MKRVAYLLLAVLMLTGRGAAQKRNIYLAGLFPYTGEWANALL